MSKHTQDEWFVVVAPGGSIRVTNGNSKTRARLPHRPPPQIICRVEEVFMDRGARIANAHLLAAAPNLFSQLRLCLRLIEDEGLDELHGDLVECARAAIAKAEGDILPGDDPVPSATPKEC